MKTYVAKLWVLQVSKNLPSHVGATPLHPPIRGQSPLHPQVLTTSPPDNPYPDIQLYVAVVPNSNSGIVSEAYIIPPLVGMSRTGHKRTAIFKQNITNIILLWSNTCIASVHCFSDEGLCLKLVMIQS